MKVIPENWLSPGLITVALVIVAPELQWIPPAVLTEAKSLIVILDDPFLRYSAFVASLTTMSPMKYDPMLSSFTT